MPRVAILGLMQAIAPRWTVKVLGDSENRKRRNIVHVIVTVFLLTSVLGVVLVVEDLGTFVAAVGMAGIAIGIIIPGVCYLGLRPITGSWRRDTLQPTAVVAIGAASIVAVVAGLVLDARTKS